MNRRRLGVQRSVKRSVLRQLPVLAWTLGVGLAALVIAFTSLGLWGVDLRVPLTGPEGDATFTISVVKGLVENGWVWSNPHLGAPFGTDFRDFPAAFGETFSLLVMRLMSLVSDDPILIVNVFFLAGFPAAAIAAFWTIRAFGLASWAAFLPALLFAIVPGHFMRGVDHLFLATYWVVPLGAWLVMGSAGVVPLVTRRAGIQGPKAWISRTSIVTVVVVLVVGTSGLYYAVFAAILVLTVGFLYLLASHRWRLFSVAIGISLALLAIVVAQQLPALLYRSEQGLNTEVAVRGPAESELYGLKLSQLLLPRAEHRFAPLARLGRNYANATQRTEGFASSLGLVFSVTLVLAVIWLLARAAGGSANRGPPRAIATAATISALTSIFWATSGGFGAILAFTVTSQIRAWNRISFYVAFFAALILAVAISECVRRLRANNVDPFFIGVGLSLFGILGILDQTAPSQVDHAALKESWRSNSRFVRSISSELAPEAKILELPYVPFPENPRVSNMADYELALPYIADRSGLKWSYGAVKGRQSDWADDLAKRPTAEVVYGAAAAGFGGLFVDRDGFDDDGAAVIGEIQALLKPQARIDSSDGRAVFFNLQEISQSIRNQVSPEKLSRIRSAVLKPVGVQLLDGFSPPEVSGGRVQVWANRDASLRVDNAASRPVRGELKLNLSGPSVSEPTTSSVSCGDEGKVVRGIFGEKIKKVRVRLTIPAKGLRCRLETTGPEGPVTRGDPRRKFLLLIDPSVNTRGLSELSAIVQMHRLSRP